MIIISTSISITIVFIFTSTYCIYHWIRLTSKSKLIFSVDSPCLPKAFLCAHTRAHTHRPHTQSGRGVCRWILVLQDTGVSAGYWWDWGCSIQCNLFPNNNNSPLRSHKLEETNVWWNYHNLLWNTIWGKIQWKAWRQAISSVALAASFLITNSVVASWCLYRTTAMPWQ